MKYCKWICCIVLALPMFSQAQLENPFNNVGSGEITTLQAENQDTSLAAFGDINAAPAAGEGGMSFDADEDPGGPTDPPSDVPVNGGLALLLVAGIGMGYRSYRAYKTEAKVPAIA
jgi:hypothetical protein